MNTGSQRTFRALADPTRRGILVYLAEEDLSIAEVAVRFDVSRSAIQKHLAVLQEGGLISIRRAGRERISHLEPGALQEVAAWLGYFDRFWDTRLNKLKSAIESEQNRKAK